ALAPNDVAWAQKLRPYGFQTMLVAIAFWGFATVVTAPAARGVLRVRLGWIAYALAGGLAMLAPHPAGLFALGCNAAVLALALHDPACRGHFLRRWIVANLVLAGIWMIWLPTFIGQVAIHLTPAAMAERHGIFLVTQAELWDLLQETLGV